jgi:rhodanese-related sulfurtransferase
MGLVVREALLVGAIGVVFALIANAFSPRGLSLTRDYFPVTSPPAMGGIEQASAGTAPAAETGVSGEVGAVEQKLREQGLEPVSDERMHSLFMDARYAQELVVFIDAREARRYQEAHIPGAYLFDRYRQDEFLPSVLPACQNAESVVVYCNGGDCEDSHFAALALRDAGVPADRLGVYSGGILAWQKRGYPMESGERGSGVMVEGGHSP